VKFESVEHEILATCHTIAVVGLSSKPERSSYGVAQYLQRHGYRIIPVNPHESEVLGERCYARLEEIPEAVDCVDVFRRAELCREVAESAVRIGAKALWLQLGIRNRVAVQLAQKAGLLAVDDRCMAVEHLRCMR
jgi:predicted CoA-binding protein